MSEQEPKYIPLQPYQMVDYKSEDEISLIDLGVMVAKQKKVFWIVFFVIILSVLVFIALKPSVYAYNTTFEIGSYKVLGQNNSLAQEPQPIESVAATVAKLTNVFIPSVQNARLAAELPISGIQISPVKDTDVIVLVSKGLKDDVNIIRQHAEVTDALILNHKQLLENNFLTGLKVELDRSQRKLAILENEVSKASFLADVKRTKAQLEMRTLVMNTDGYVPPKIINIDSSILSYEQAYSRSREFAISLKMQLGKLVDQEQLAKERLAILKNNKTANQLEINDLRRAIKVEIPNQSSQLITEINANEREAIDAEKSISSLKVQRIILQEEYAAEKKQLVDDFALAEQSIELKILEYEQSIAVLENYINTLTEQASGINSTKAIAVAERSIASVGVSSKLILAVGVILALFVGLIGCFISAYITRVNTSLKESFNG